MDISQFKRVRPLFILLIITGLMILTVWIRSFPFLNSIDLQHYLTFYSPDIWYNFRQIELLVHNYPVYNWFDPMTSYPTGKLVDWGPFLPFVIASLSIVTGMTSRQDIMYLASWVIPLFAAFMIPVTYYIGKTLWDWKTGILACSLLSITSGIYFVTSAFGYVDHHILEALFGALFCLMYMVTLKYGKQHSPAFTFQRATLIFLGLSLSTSLVYFAGFLTMPTMIIFGVVVALYTFFQFISDRFAKKTDTNLLFTNLVIFSLLLVFMAIFGVHQPGTSLQQYSVAHIFAMVLIVGETLVMYALSRWLNKSTGLYILAAFGFNAVIVLSILTTGHGAFYRQIMIFGRITEIRTIAESQPWSLDLAVSSFNLMVILSTFGFVILLYHVYTKKQEEQLFFMIWSLIIFLLTTQYLRFESYFAVNVTLLSSLCIVTGLTTGFAKVGFINYRFGLPRQVITEMHNDRPAPKKPLKDRGKSSRPVKKSPASRKVKNSKILGAVIIAVILGTTIISVGLSIQGDIDTSSSPGNIISNSWVETMEWLGAHTPDPGINYLGVYQKESFAYPKTAYGILSWWDYGHYITYIGKRIPVTNPFQDHLYSSNTAGFYLSRSEADATRILQFNGVRYVITDTPIATDKFGALVAINRSSADLPVFMKTFYRPILGEPGQYMQFEGKLPPYFQTTVARLHIFDWSIQIPGTITYLEYYDENRDGLSYHMGTYEKALPVADATNAIRKFEQEPQGNSKAVLVGQYLQPLERVPALQHFRMVHESLGNSSDIRFYDISGAENLKLVKVFEFVPGAHIRGDGTIELNVVTNTGREFTYRQESVNGEFVVPYSTVNNLYDVHANGTYHIVGTTRAIDVTEEDVLKGLFIVA